MYVYALNDHLRVVNYDSHLLKFFISMRTSRASSSLFYSHYIFYIKLNLKRKHFGYRARRACYAVCYNDFDSQMCVSSGTVYILQERR